MDTVRETHYNEKDYILRCEAEFFIGFCEYLRLSKYYEEIEINGELYITNVRLLNTYFGLTCEIDSGMFSSIMENGNIARISLEDYVKGKPERLSKGIECVYDTPNSCPMGSSGYECNCMDFSDMLDGGSSIDFYSKADVWEYAKKVYSVELDRFINHDTYDEFKVYLTTFLCI